MSHEVLAETPDTARALGRATFYFLFGVDEKKPNNLARTTVFRFRKAPVFLKVAPDYRSDDASMHEKILSEILGLVGLETKFCGDGPEECGGKNQRVTLSLRDNKEGSLQQLANELGLSSGPIDVGKNKYGGVALSAQGQTFPISCLLVYPTAQPASEAALQAALVNIVKDEATRFQCTAEKALLLIGFAATPEMVHSAETIVAAIITGEHASRSMLPEKSLIALDLLYSDGVDGPLSEEHTWELLRAVQ